ncbi:MAG: hypothetical protein JO203_05575 [Gammaproteobacteria bacterium]|nr:hypothetical protein [Gammaproteobacteria bacterium]
MKRLIAAGVVSGVLVLAGGCGNTGYGTATGQADLTLLNGNPGGSTPPAQPTSSTALFNLTTGQLPYPTDLYFAGSTAGTLNIPLTTSLYPSVTTALNNLDGFSTTGVIRAYFGGALDPKTLAAPGAVTVLQVTIDNKTRATTGVVRPLIPGTDYSVNVAADQVVGASILEITPLHPLVPSTGLTDNGYLVLLTNAITDAAGQPAVPDTDYATIKAALPTCSSLQSNATLYDVCLLTGAHLQIAGAVHLNPANVVLSFSFSTQSIGDTMAVVEQLAAPQAIQVNCPPQLKAASPLHAADVCVGVTMVPYYLSRSAPLTANWQGKPSPLDGKSTALTRFNPEPVATEMLQIPVLVSVPNASGPPPAGWPVAIVAHGLTRSREDALAMADSFASAGFVVFAIDMPLHGITNQMDPFYASGANPFYTGLGLPAPTTRTSIERTFDLDLGTNNAAGNGVNYGSPPDGKIDPSGSWFLNLTAPLVGRDNFREGPADFITIAHSLEKGGITVIAPAGTIKIDPSRVHYVGLSLGAVVGTVYLGSTPNIADAQTGSLAAPGGGFARYLTESATFSAAFLPVLEAQGLIPGTTLFAQYTRDLQNITDAGDPWNFITAAVANHPTHVMQMVGGGITAGGTATLPDQVIPNVGTQRLISAAPFGGANGTLGGPGIVELNTPGNNLSAGGWRAYTNFICGVHGSLFDPTASPATTTEMQTEAVSFAAGSTAGNVISIANPGVIAPQPAGTKCP